MRINKPIQPNIFSSEMPPQLELGVFERENMTNNQYPLIINANLHPITNQTLLH